MNTLPDSAGFHSSLNKDQLVLAQALKGVVDNKDSTKSDILDATKALAWSLIIAEYDTLQGGHFTDPVIQFLIGASLEMNGSLKQSGDITSVVASLQYFFRLFVFAKSVEDATEGNRSLIK